MRTRRLTLVPIAVIGALVTLTACTSAPAADEVGPMWQAEIARVRETNPSDLIVAALDDYHVSDAELEQARQAHVDCMAGHGIAIEWFADGTHQSTRSLDIPERSADIASCECGIYTELELLHREMRYNPAGLSHEDEIRACFEEHGVPDGGGLTREQFEQFIWADRDYVPSSDQAVSCIHNPRNDPTIDADLVGQLERARREQAATGQRANVIDLSYRCPHVAPEDLALYADGACLTFDELGPDAPWICRPPRRGDTN